MDLTGQRFGRWTVVSSTDKRTNDNGAIWLCLCDCGNKKEVPAKVLRSGDSKSCGCYNIDRMKERFTTHGQSIGRKQTNEYRTWMDMMNRCCWGGHPDYSGRGIGVCERWANSFENFFEDMGKRPEGKYSLERVNNDLGYSPDNCIWATKRVQTRNTRRNRWLEHNGVRMVMKDWQIYLGVPYSTFHKRLTKLTLSQIIEKYYPKKKMPNG